MLLLGPLLANFFFLFLSLNCMPLVQSPFQQYRVVCLVNRQFHHLPQLFVRLRYQLDLTAPAPGPISVRAAISRPAAPSNQQPATNCLLGCLWLVQAGVSPFSAAVSFPVPSIQFILNWCTLPCLASGRLCNPTRRITSFPHHLCVSVYPRPSSWLFPSLPYLPNLPSTFGYSQLLFIDPEKRCWSR